MFCFVPLSGVSHPPASAKAPVYLPCYSDSQLSGTVIQNPPTTTQAHGEMPDKTQGQHEAARLDQLLEAQASP